jgi:hypothetical protein
VTGLDEARSFGGSADAAVIAALVGGEKIGMLLSETGGKGLAFRSVPIKRARARLIFLCLRALAIPTPSVVGRVLGQGAVHLGMGLASDT